MGFRENLQHLRTTRNMTQEQLAMLLGVSRQAVSKWESERTYPEMDKLLRICSLFECKLDDLVMGDLTHRQVDRIMSIPQGQSPQDITGYDKSTCGYALKLPAGILSILLGAALAVLWAALSTALGNGLSDYAVVIACIGTTVGIVFILSAASARNGFQKAHPFIEDFYTAEQKSGARAEMLKGAVLGAVLIAAGIAGAVLLRSFELFAWAAFLSLFAAAVFCILRGYLLWLRMDVERYNQRSFSLMTEREIAALDDVELRRIARKAKRKRSVCVIIMSLATIVGLCLLFIPQLGAYRWFWLAWAIGGMLCVAANLYLDIRGEE
ncbi:MAG TPA: helix-turn-helix transcriptional regulator [Atopobiaceae bacterium]|nr:XRE family transcriptional regulator [Coriobacteriales bacterium OH1046]HQE69876.1 helix-turn-helix transcriptional regulator [Atopobiaceae bacterium]